MITSLLGELEDLRWASVAQAIARAREHPDVIVGIKVRLGYQMVGDDPAPAMRLAREAADTLGLPLMVHVIDMRPPISWLLPYMGRGDIVTHCYPRQRGRHPRRRRRAVPRGLQARERGVRFDVGHGVGSFSYQVARQAIAQGFPPDTISSDLHAHNVHGPAFDQATTLSKLLHAGMDLPDVIRATTATPALAVRRPGPHRRAGGRPGGRPDRLRAPVRALGAARRGRGHRDGRAAARPPAPAGDLRRLDSPVQRLDARHRPGRR